METASKAILGIIGVGLLLTLLWLFLGRSQGNVTTTVLPIASLSPGSSEPGVIFYPPSYVKVTHSFKTLVDGNGDLLGKAPDGCMPVIEKEEMLIMADLSKPLRIENNSGQFSAAKFAVTLNNGMLVSVNAEPTQKPSDLLTAMMPGAPKAPTPGLPRTIRRPGPAVILQACNAGSEITNFARATLQ